MKKKKVVIVGGGTAGLIIADNLQDTCDVLLLEKSKLRSTPIFNKIPLLIGPLYRKKVLKYISKLDILAQKGRTIPFFESCVFGGASVINGCVHALGLRSCWEAELKRFSLGFDDVTDAHEKIYSSSIFNSCKKITLRSASHNVLDESFFQSLKRLGFNETGLSLADQCGFGKVINTVGLFFRSSVLSTLQKRKFNIHTGERVTEIKKSNNNRFEIVSDSHKFAADYVILCSGVIGTNVLLLNEGVGTIDDRILQKYNVGLNIKDHSNIRVNVRSSKSFGSLNEISESLMKKLYLLTKHFLGFNTLLLGTGATSGIHVDLDGDGLVDARIHLLQFSESGRHKSDGKDFCAGSGFSLSITPIQTRSSGKIVIDETGAPKIDPNYFSEKLDLEHMKSALLFCLDLLSSEPLKEYVAEIEDYELMKNQPENYIRKTFFSGHHLIGGCSDLVDQNFEVNDNSGLFICDASIFSDFVSSNIHAPVVLIAKLFSDRFLERLEYEGNGDENAWI